MPIHKHKKVSISGSHDAYKYNIFLEMGNWLFRDDERTLLFWHFLALQWMTPFLALMIINVKFYCVDYLELQNFYFLLFEKCKWRNYDFAKFWKGKFWTFKILFWKFDRGNTTVTWFIRKFLAMHKSYWNSYLSRVKKVTMNTNILAEYLLDL